MSMDITINDAGGFTFYALIGEGCNNGSCFGAVDVSIYKTPPIEFKRQNSMLFPMQELKILKEFQTALQI